MTEQHLPVYEAGQVAILHGLSELTEHFDVILCDIWGVLHNGATPHPGAWQALARARDKGTSVILISNAPRPGEEIERALQIMGIPRDAFDGTVTSGDLARSHLEASPGIRIYHIGPQQVLVSTQN